MAFSGSNITTYQKRETPYWLNYVYAGQMFKWTYYVTITGSNSLYYLIKTPATGLCHSLTRLVSIASGELQVSLIENPTVTAYSSEKTSNNLYRPSSKIANTKFYTTVSNSGGTIIDEMYINSYSSYAGKILQPSGSLVAGLTERIYKPNTNYVIRLQNLNVTDYALEIIELFYESGN